MSSISKSEENLRIENDTTIKCIIKRFYNLYGKFNKNSFTLKVKEFIDNNIKKLSDCYIGKERCSYLSDIENLISEIDIVDTLCSYKDFKESFPEYLPVISLIYYRYIENYYFDDGIDPADFRSKYRGQVCRHIDNYTSAMYEDQYYTIRAFVPSIVTNAIVLSRYGYGYNENEKISRTINLIKNIMYIHYISPGALTNIFGCIGRFHYSDLISSLLLMAGGLRDCCVCDYDVDVYNSITLATLDILNSMSKSDINYILLNYNIISSYTYGYRFNFNDPLVLDFDNVVDVVIDLRGKGYSI